MRNNSLISRSISAYLISLQGYWLMVWVVSLITLIPLSLSAKTAPPDTDILNLLKADKLLHFVVYGSLALMPLILEPVRQRAALFVLIVTMQSIVLEAIQVAIPGRSGSMSDVIANISGILFAIVLALVCRQFKPPVRKNGKASHTLTLPQA